MEPAVPRTWTFRPVGALDAYARHESLVGRLILARSCSGSRPARCARSCCRRSGERISLATASRVAQQLNEAAVAFHGRPLANRQEGRLAMAVSGVAAPFDAYECRVILE